jgi:putative transposase
MSGYQNKYRVESIRWKDWDYTNPWWYFVTVNTKKHIKYFGKVVYEHMVMNDLGKIAVNYWKEIPKHFTHVETDQFILMPNHLHGIIIINPITNVETPD